MMFGETVRAHRQRLAMTQEDLSGKAGIGVRTIREIEAGRRSTPRPATVCLLADAFGLRGPDRDRFNELAHAVDICQPATAGTDSIGDDAPPVEFTGWADQLRRLRCLLTSESQGDPGVRVCIASRSVNVDRLIMLASRWLGGDCCCGSGVRAR